MSLPAIILVEPQLGENIGAVARIMANFGLSDLRLVAPRDGWPNPKAEEMAAGGIAIVNNARIFPSLEEAIADLQYVVATSARQIRDMEVRSLAPRESIANIPEDFATGIMFGRERIGLTNDEITFADSLVSIPVSKDCPSLNIAQAVAIITYEWHLRFGENSVSKKPEKSPYC